MTSEEDQLTIERISALLGSGHALAQDIEEYVVGYGVLGNLVASAQGEYEYAEQRRKTEWSKAFLAAKRSEDKMTEKIATAIADLSVDELRHDEIEKHVQVTQLKAMRDTVLEAINGLKYLGRMGG